MVFNNSFKMLRPVCNELVFRYCGREAGDKEAKLAPVCSVIGGGSQDDEFTIYFLTCPNYSSLTQRFFLRRNRNIWVLSQTSD